MSPASAIVLLVPEAEPHVGALRAKHDPAARLGMPPHVTLLFPFVPVAEIDAEVDRLETFFAAQRPFDFALGKTGRFGNDVLWLAPDPANPFLDLARGLWARYPDNPPYGGEFNTAVFHLTVAHAKDDKEKLDKIAARIEPELPVPCRAHEATLMVADARGRWTTRATFPLASTQRARYSGRT